MKNIFNYLNKTQTMKRIFTSSFLGLAISGLLLASCSQMASYENEDLALEQARADKAGFTLSPYGNIAGENAREFVDNPDCETECLEKGIAYNFSKSYSSDVIEVGSNSKVISATVSLVIDASAEAYYEIEYFSERVSGKSNASVYLFGTLNGFPFGSSTVEAGKWNDNNPVQGYYRTPKFNYNTINCGDTFDFELTEVSIDEVNPVNLFGTNYLLAYCPEGCDIEGNEFSGEAISCDDTREAVYKFGSEDGVEYFKIQGGLTNFTGENASVYINGTIVNFNSISDDGWNTGVVGDFTIGQRTPGASPTGGSSNRNIRIEGGLESCNELEVKILWNSSNSGGTITGDWSVKDGGGIELAPTILGLTCPE